MIMLKLIAFEWNCVFSGLQVVQFSINTFFLFNSCILVMLASSMVYLGQL